MGDAKTISIKKPCIDVDKIRADFPVLSKEIGGKPLIYLDNGATTQKPWQVINRVSQFDSEEYGTVRRGSYRLCENSTRLYEEARQKVADFLGAPTRQEIVFTSGTTQAINLVAHSFGRKFVNAGDEVIILYRICSITFFTIDS